MSAQTYEEIIPEAEDLLGDPTGVIEAPTEAECYLYAILTDVSGLDIAEFLKVDEEQPDGCFRAWEFQWSWFRCRDMHQIDQCGRAVGKSLSILLRAMAFPLCYAGREMLITAPELNHLEPLIILIEEQFYATRFLRELRVTGRGSVTHRPFAMKFANGARIIGCIPQRDGRGVKGKHPLVLEHDESQDYPKGGWKELTHTLKRGSAGAQWRAHGVSRGIQDDFYARSQPESGWTVHRISQIHRPNWSDSEREKQIKEAGGSREDPDYKRNIYGTHGSAVNRLFILHRLMKCVDAEPESEYNSEEYYSVSISDSDLEETQGVATDFLDLPAKHTAKYNTFWIGMDIGFISDPSEILVFAEYRPSAAERRLDVQFKRAEPIEGSSRVKLVARITLVRMPNPEQVKVILAVIAHYKPRVFACDKTGAGLPLFQDVQALIAQAQTPEEETRARLVAETIKGYNFSEKILVEIDETVDVEANPAIEATDPEQVAKEAGIERLVLEWSTDCLRRFVDEERLFLPWDREVIGEFQGQTFQYTKSAVDPYGRRRRIFSEGKFHALDAARMAIMGLVQHEIEEFVGRKKVQAPVLDSVVDPY